MSHSTPSILLVDGYSLLFRGFHALPPLEHNGIYTNAIHGFFSMMLKAVDSYRPNYLCVMLDAHAPTFRHTMYPDYKGTRKPAPDELIPQFKLLRELLTATHIAHIEIEGYEADDLLGTASKLANESGVEAYILTGDRDSLQLVNEHTNVILTKKGITESLLLNPEGVFSNYGYTPEQVTDMKALMGDSSDNIPGIAGIGEKTALKLISEYGNLTTVFKNADKVKGKLGEKLRNGQKNALISKELATINITAPLSLDFNNCTYVDMPLGVAQLRHYGLNRIATIMEKTASAAPATQAITLKQTTASKRAEVVDEVLPVKTVSESDIKFESVKEPEEAIVISNLETFALNKPQLTCAKEMAFHRTDTLFSLYVEASNKLFLFPVRIDMASEGFHIDELYSMFVPLLENCNLIVHDAKGLYTTLNASSFKPTPIIFDSMLASYLLHTEQKEFNFEESYLLEFEKLPTGEPNAHDLFSLYQRQNQHLVARELNALYYDVELPLSKVLFSMERAGFLLDLKLISDLGVKYSKQIEECRQAVYSLTGFSDFNLNSPKQLGEVLFERLKLEPMKKGKKGAYSTNAEVLESLVDAHPAIEQLLTYRKLSKLQGTYIEGLRKLVSADGRIHTTFDQTATVTGRISSYEPNLQNIPIRTDAGRDIRRAFIAKPGYVLIDADYSQIELRVLAHMSNDPVLIASFLNNEDIHSRTAAEINEIPIQSVTPDMRRAAKAINFGIVYGISGFGLAKNVGISKKEADHFISRYLARYQKVHAFMDECVSKGNELGYAKTLLGRRRELFELSSSNRNIRNFGERAAMNTPVQGTAADIIKIAMVQVYNALENSDYDAKLILQVHDELVLECREDQADSVSALLSETMRNAISLCVPLDVDAHIGVNWDDAH